MKNRMQLLFRGMSAAGLAVTLLVMGCSGPTAVKPAVDKTVALSPVASTPQGGLPTEGIKVHGHWTIEVRNADGTVAEVREFENALTPYGTGTLSKILGRANSVGGWSIQLDGSTFVSGAWLDGWGLTSALIKENTLEDYEPRHFGTLTVAAPFSGPNANKLVLSGTATAQRDGDIGHVSTTVNLLSNTEVPSPSYGAGSSVLTKTTLPTPINLLAGQQVLVTVVISFS